MVGSAFAAGAIQLAAGDHDGGACFGQRASEGAPQMAGAPRHESHSAGEIKKPLNGRFARGLLLCHLSGPHWLVH